MRVDRSFIMNLGNCRESVVIDVREVWTDEGCRILGKGAYLSDLICSHSIWMSHHICLRL